LIQDHGQHDHQPFDDHLPELRHAEQHQPIGQYAVKLAFDDGHDSGLYSWNYLRELGTEYDKNWAKYQARLQSVQ